MADEEALGPELALVDAVISALPSGLMTIDADGAIEHANRAAAQIFGRELEALMGRELTSLRGELEAMLWPADKGEVLLLPTGRSGELQFDDARVIGFSSRTLRDSSGKRVGMVVSFADITRAKARSTAEAHRRRLADIGKLVSTVAHEIRNPVFAIASLGQVLGTEDAVADDPELKEMADKIVEEARRIGRLVDDLLVFGRERRLDRKRTNVVDLVETIADDIRRALGDDAPVPLRVDVSEAMREQPIWDVDPEALRRVVSNLMRNSWQAVVARKDDREPDHGVTVRLGRKADTLVIVVGDDGIGIPEAKRDKIFDAFYTTRHTGTGLGLAIVDRLVKQHHGTVDVESTEGKGTTITLRIPP